jgi:pilin isopeptide linkage protein
VSDISTQAQIQATKRINSNSPDAMSREFRFNLMESGRLISTATNDTNGIIVFPPIDYDTPGGHDYQINEVVDNPPLPGWNYDYHSCTVRVEVTADPETGKLTAKVIFEPDISPNFVNTYTSSNTPFTIQNKVIGHGKTPGDGEFGFDLVDENGNVIGHAHNDANGNIVFPNIELPVGDHDLKILPPPDGNGWVFDKPYVPVHVKVIDNGNGTTSTQITYPDDPNFIVTYTPAPGKLNMIAHKVLHGWTLPTKSNKVFTFVLKDENGNVIKSVEGTDGTIDFGDIDLTQIGDHKYTISEQGTDSNGWTLDQNEYPVTVTVTDDGKAHLVGSADNVPNLTNIYKPAPASTGEYGVPQVKKAVSGGPALKDGQFTFGIFDADDNLISTGTNDANGNIKFPVGYFEKAGEYNYTIKETTPSGGGYTVDGSSYPYKVVVTDDGLGQLHGVITQPTPTPTFTNTYHTEGSQSILLYKSLQGWNNGLTAPNFTFTLKDSSGNEIKNVVSNGGTLNFGLLHYTEAGDYDYTVEENKPLPPGWIIPKSSYRIRVHMEDDGSGNLIATVTYPDEGTSPEFVNTYSALPANVGKTISNNPSGENPTKFISGSGTPLKDDQFRFGLYDANGNLISLGFNKSDGRIDFPLFFVSKLGESNFTMKELSTDGAGWITDTAQYPVKVVVTDDGEGHQNATVTYPDGTPVFHNVYQAADASVGIKGKVIGRGKTPGDGEFEFQVTDDAGNVVGKAYNDGNGNIIFPHLELPDGEYHYHMVAPPDGGGWIFDTHDLPVDITVTDNGDGTSSSKVTYPKGDTFYPTYTPIPGDISVSLNSNGNAPQKAAEGKALADQEFSFGLYDENGNLVGTGVNDETGKITFTHMYTISEGDHMYTMKELTVDGNGWVTDQNAYPLMVHVSSNNGIISATASWPAGVPPTFINRYHTKDAEVNVEGTVVGSPKQPDEGQLQFELVDQNGNVVGTATNDKDGNIIFPGIDLPQGDYDLVMKAPPNGDGWHFDEPELPVHVHVVDNGDGTSTSIVTYPDGSVFHVIYGEPVNVTVQGHKKVDGAVLLGGRFTFGLFDDSGAQVGMVTNGENGTAGDVVFPDLSFNTPGVYHYTMKELTPSGGDWQCDNRVFGLTITVTDNGKGDYIANVAYDGGVEPEFINYYAPSDGSGDTCGPCEPILPCPPIPPCPPCPPIPPYPPCSLCEPCPLFNFCGMCNPCQPCNPCHSFV